MRRSYCALTKSTRSWGTRVSYSAFRILCPTSAASNTAILLASSRVTHTWRRQTWVLNLRSSSSRRSGRLRTRRAPNATGNTTNQSRPHWGIKMPQLDGVVKRHVKQHTTAGLLQLAQTLWDSGTFDLMMAAGRILGRREIPVSPRLWHTLDAWLDDVDGWALEDVLAPAAWKCLLDDPAVLDDMEHWTTHPGVWRRRAALVYTLPYAKPGHDPERVLTWAAGYAADPGVVRPEGHRLVAAGIEQARWTARRTFSASPLAPVAGGCAPGGQPPSRP